MEDDVAAGAGGEKRSVVSDITVDDFESSGVGRRRKCGEITGGPDKDPN